MAPTIRPYLAAEQVETLGRLRWRNVGHVWRVGEVVAHWSGSGIGTITSIDWAPPARDGSQGFSSAVVLFRDGSWERLRRHEMVRADQLSEGLRATLGGLEVAG